MTFAGAKQICKEKSLGLLASITTKEMQNIFHIERKKRDMEFVWIGLKKKGKYVL